MMTNSLTRACVAAAALLLGGCANILLPPNITPVVASTTSVAEAERKLASVATQTAAIEAEFLASEQECYRRFFVNSCLDKAKEKRRSALAYQKAIDIEAQHFRRKAVADQRDREVARAVAEFNADQARAAAQPPRPAVVAEPKPRRAGRATLQERRASQNEKLAERAAREQAEAPERAASVREYEQRRVEAAERQREVAERIADREAKNAAPYEKPAADKADKAGEKPAPALPVKK